jgi:hypothetical protein
VEARAPGRAAPLKVDWEHVRDASPENAEQWLAIFRRDEPSAIFVAAATKPRGKRGPKVMRGPGSTC